MSRVEKSPKEFHVYFKALSSDTKDTVWKFTVQNETIRDKWVFVLTEIRRKIEEEIR